MNKIIAVMPCYRSSKIAPKIAKDVLSYVDRLVCVDDDCQKIRENLSKVPLKWSFGFDLSW